MEFKDFYIHLGKLAYAVAMADGNVQQEEIDKLRLDLKEILLPLESDLDEFGMDSAFYTEFEFEKLMDQEVEVAAAFKEFIAFAENNKGNITDKMKEVSIKIIENVANAYQGIIKEEQVLIDELKSKFKEI
jgi:hypothetical protein